MKDGEHTHPVHGRWWHLRAVLRALYHGSTKKAVRFRLSVITLDIILIGFFIAAPFFREQLTFIVADYIIAVVLIIELAARMLANSDIKRQLLKPTFWIDVFILGTLLFPFWLANFAFLRVMRLWSLVHSEFFWDTVARRYDDSRWEDTTKAVATLVTYLFIVTGFVYALYARQHPGIDGYVDALYFTVTTVTTTGYGDVLLPGTGGRLLSILIMVSGISLFVSLIQSVLRPSKVRFTCPACGLMRHDLDAAHCKACGTLINIPNDG